MQELAKSAINLLIRIKGPRRGSRLALVLFHALAWLEELFGGHKVLFSIPRGWSAGKEGKKLFLRDFVFLTHISLAAVKPLSRSALLVESHAGGGQRTWPDGGAEP